MGPYVSDLAREQDAVNASKLSVEYMKNLSREAVGTHYNECSPRHRHSNVPVHATSSTPLHALVSI
jgi:hypothetical protein